MRVRRLLGAVALLCATGALPARAHCDGMDGPVVAAARRALETKDVNYALAWVRPDDESEIRRSFDQTIEVRRLGPAARELADRYFFETLVRIHRAGEGAAYTGLKPAGRDLGPAIPAGDRAVESGALAPVIKLLGETVQSGLRERFDQVIRSRADRWANAEQGRRYVSAYIDFIHFVESVHQAAGRAAGSVEHQQHEH